MIKFSVLMSVYKNDNAEYLKIALESIYEKQSRKPDEIVIVFDGPLTENLYIVVDNFCADKKDVVKLIKLEQNGGLGNALRIGSMECSYEYIFRMDSDDISDSRRFERQVAFVELHPEYDVVGTYIAEFNDNANESMRVRVVPLNHDEIVKLAKKRNPMNHVTVCIKKSALVACGGYETVLLLEDYFLWLKMIVAGCKLTTIPESLVYVRIGNGFNSKRGSKTRVKGWRVLQNYMLEHKMINRAQAEINMISVWAFVNTPAVLKKFLYSYFLRK